MHPIEAQEALAERESMSDDVDALRREVQELREEKAALVALDEKCSVEWETTLGSLNDENERLKRVLAVAEEAVWYAVCLCEESGNESLKATNAYAENKKALELIRRGNPK